MSYKAALFLAERGQGALPLLKPSNTLMSFSYHLDLGKMWQHKDKWLGTDETKGLEDAEKKAAPFMGGIKIGKGVVVGSVASEIAVGIAETG